MASHELKTPLTSLTALIQVLQIKLKEGSDPFIPQALNKAIIQAKRMSSLINGFLNVSRLESGKLDINKQSFDITVLAAEEVEEIRLTAAGHIFVLSNDQPLTIFADRQKIGSVISNFLSNAAKYSPKGKLIQLISQLKRRP